MSKFTSFEEIQAWQKARELVRVLYRMTEGKPFARDFGLRDQIRRAGVSIMANIAEGHERGGNKEFIHFLSMAKASSGEVRSHLYVALDQHYLNDTDARAAMEQCVEVSKMLAGLISYLRGTTLKGAKYSALPD